MPRKARIDAPGALQHKYKRFGKLTTLSKVEGQIPNKKPPDYKQKPNIQKQNIKR